MRAFLATARGVGEVRDVEPPTPGPGQVVVDVALVGVCGTDVSIFFGDEARIGRNRLTYPIRLGHEWCGTVSAVGERVDAGWIGRRVTGKTLIGCGECARCLAGLDHLCDDRYGIGVRRNWPGALAEQLLVPERSLLPMPDTVTDEMGAMVEPGGNAYRAVAASGAASGRRILIIGSGNIGLLAAQFSLAAGAEVHVLGIDDSTLDLSRRLGVAGAWKRDDLPQLTWDTIIEASTSPEMPQFAFDTVEPGGTVVLIGVSITPSITDSRRVVHKELVVRGILGGTAGLAPAISAYASGAVDPRPLVADVVGLEVVPSVLAGEATGGSGSGTKFLIDPTR